MEQRESNQSERRADDRDKRQRALWDLASQRAPGDDSTGVRRDKPARAPGAVIAPRTHHNRLWMVFVAGGLVAVLIAVLVTHSMLTGRVTGNARRSTVSITPSLQCEQDIAWSPDSTRVAIIGYERACPSAVASNYNYQVGAVAIYDTRSGQLVANFDPDAPIAAALNLQPPAFVTPVSNPPGDVTHQIIQYSQIAWSRDGTQLAIPFAVDVVTGSTPTGGEQITSIRGLLLSDAQGARQQVLAHTLSHEEAYSGAWNVATGTYIPTSMPLSSLFSGNWQIGPALGTPALGYTWGASGALFPNTPLTTTESPAAPALAPIGQPIGGAHFTIWQPGQFATQFGSPSQGSGQVELPGTYTFSTDIIAWSPDMWYILTAQAQNWRVQPSSQPVPSLQGLKDLGLAQAPVLPARDAAFAEALALAPATDPRSANHADGIAAWSSDGRLLSVHMASADSGAGTVNSSVRMYNCATGKLLTTLTTSAQFGNGSGTDSLLRWSPDSSHLLWFDALSATVTIWGSQLWAS